MTAWTRRVPAPWPSVIRATAPSKASSSRAPNMATIHPAFTAPRHRRRCCAAPTRSVPISPPDPEHRSSVLPDHVLRQPHRTKDFVMTIHDPSLRAALKTLKLTGMLDTLDARLAQTRAGELGHLEFLQVLGEDEIARRDTAALARRVRRARFEQHATFEDFDFTVSPKLPAAMLRDLAALRWLEAGESVSLYGPVGVGKTHVAQALGHQVARRGGDIRFVKCSRMLADLAGGHADRTIGQRMREYTRPLVLIVDDFAMREHTPTQSDDLYDLVSDRAIAAKPLILTSNRAPKDWYPLFPNPVVAESLLDRLINTSHQILTNGTQGCS